jgi:hypothetical protein
MGALGMAVATGESSVLFERGKGVRFRWTLRPLRPRELFIPVKDISQLEISRVESSSNDGHGARSTRVHYELHVVTQEGKAVALESFSLQAQAKLRQAQIEAVLRLPAKVRAPRKRAATRKKSKASV